MASLKNLRKELEELKNEIMSKRSGVAEAAVSGDSGGAPENKMGATALAAIENQIEELNRMVKTALDEAETTVAEHPVATVAGALALGIVIGRLSGR